MTRLLRSLLVLVTTALAIGWGLTPAHAADGDAAITHVSSTDQGLQILVSVPEGAKVDLGKVSVRIAGKNADATAQLASDDTKIKRTTVLAIDTMSNGDLYYLEEGELWRVPVPGRLEAAVGATSAEGGMPEVRKLVIPAGATDALPFLVRGYEAMGLTCVDPSIGAPRH